MAKAIRSTSGGTGKKELSAKAKRKSAGTAQGLPDQERTHS
jgi:hypothetical protein